MLPERSSWSGTEEVQKRPHLFLGEFPFLYYRLQMVKKMSREISPTVTEVNRFKGSGKSGKHTSTLQSLISQKLI